MVTLQWHSFKVAHTLMHTGSGADGDLGWQQRWLDPQDLQGLAVSGMARQVCVHFCVCVCLCTRKCECVCVLTKVKPLRVFILYALHFGCWHTHVRYQVLLRKSFGTLYRSIGTFLCTRDEQEGFSAQC
jgi:hypothetical protein